MYQFIGAPNDKKKRTQKGEKKVKALNAVIAVNKDCSIKKINSREWKIVYNCLKSFNLN